MSPCPCYVARKWRKYSSRLSFVFLHGPRGNHLLKRGSKGTITVEETLRVTKKMWAPHSCIYQAASSLKRNETEMKPSTPFKFGDNCSKPSYLAAESVLNCFVPAPGSTVGIQHKAKGKVVSSLHYTIP